MKWRKVENCEPPFQDFVYYWKFTAYGGMLIRVEMKTNGR